MSVLDGEGPALVPALPLPLTLFRTSWDMEASLGTEWDVSVALACPLQGTGNEELLGLCGQPHQAAILRC
jgi:hypothetical protein